MLNQYFNRGTADTLRRLQIDILFDAHGCASNYPGTVDAGGYSQNNDYRPQTRTDDRDYQHHDN